MAGLNFYKITAGADGGQEIPSTGTPQQSPKPFDGFDPFDKLRAGRLRTPLRYANLNYQRKKFQTKIQPKKSP